MSIDDFRGLSDPPPDGAEYLNYDPPVLILMRHKWKQYVKGYEENLSIRRLRK